MNNLNPELTKHVYAHDFVHLISFLLRSQRATCNNGKRRNEQKAKVFILIQNEIVTNTWECLQRSSDIIRISFSFSILITE